MPRSRRPMALATALALLLLGTAFTAPVSAAHVACGLVITESTTLHSDVGPCPGDGLIVAADGVVLDLNGHEVRGVNGAEETAGVVLRRVSGVTVTNGTVTGFDAGVVVGAGDANVVRRLTVVDNVGNSLACNLGDGIAVFNSQRNLITDNAVAHNGVGAGGYGIAMLPNGPLGPVVRSSGNTVRGNTVVANTTDGIHVPRGSTDNALVANQGSGNVRYDGADLNDQCDDNSWVRNAFVTVSQPCVAGKQGPKPKQQQGGETVTVTTRAMPDLP